MAVPVNSNLGEYYNGIQLGVYDGIARQTGRQGLFGWSAKTWRQVGQGLGQGINSYRLKPMVLGF
jgi:hypothetical protein